MTLTIGFKTHVGIVRSSNQDSYAVLRRGDLSNRLDALLVLADGMGGTGGGDIASSIVAQTVPDTILEFLYDRTSGTGTPDVEKMLRETFTRANHKVWTTRKFERPDLKQMGTTCVTAVVHEGELTVANLGDSRAYLLRAGKLRQLTDDHSEVWQEVTAGRMTREEAQNSRFRNRITRAIGLGPEVKTDIFHVPLQDGDTVLLCSDGLNAEVRDSDIAHIMASTADIQQVCELLVDTALQHGGHDNVTVVALRYGSFVPTVLPVTTDEDDTDPDQAWRSQIRRPLPNEDDDFEDELESVAPSRSEPRPARPAPEPMSHRSRREANSNNGILVGLLLLVAAVAAVEGYLLYQNSLKQKTPVEQAFIPQKLPGDPHNYGAPKLLLKNKEVLDNCLVLDDEGNPIVASSSGNLLRVRLNNGTWEPLASSFPNLPAAKKIDQLPYEPAHADFALDPSGNLFTIDTETRSISIYSKSGTRVGSNIGREQLTAPVRIAVNADDVIFVIDNHKLYRIDTTRLDPNTTPGH